MDTTLQVKHLEVKYYTRQAALTAVRNLNFEVNRGEIVGLVGESGCGKSTVAAAVLGLLPPNGEISAGEMLFQGVDLRRLGKEQLRRLRGREVSMIFQDPMTSLNPVFNIEQQMVDSILAHPGEGERLSREAARRQAVEMLDRVGIPDAHKQIRNYPHQFSGGMRQRIMIAMALHAKPSLLIADEPTSALDVTLESQITSLIRQLRDELHTSILYITHDLGVVAQLCDQVVVLYAGNIVEKGDVFALFKTPLHPYTQALLRSHPSQRMRAQRLTTIPGRVPSLKDLPPGCKFAPRCTLAQAVCFTQEPSTSQVGQQSVLCHAYLPGWLGQTAGVSPADHPNTLHLTDPGSKAATPVALAPAETVVRVVETRQVGVHFLDSIGWLEKLMRQPRGKVLAVDGVDIGVYRGETLALVGESGSGKTTLGRTILRLEQPTQGEIWVEGNQITSLPQAKIRPLRARMQMIFQDPISSLSPRKKVADLLTEPYQIHNFPPERRQSVDELLEMVGLSSEQADKYPHELSGGQARRVGIARALALQPALLVADEPTAGLDVSVAAGILNLMNDLRERFHLTYILITHNLNIIAFIADRVAVMYLGKIVEVGDTLALFNQPRHPYTEALMSAVAIPDPETRHQRKRIILQGEIPSPRNPPSGCAFHPRCHYRQEICAKETPPLTETLANNHLAACHFSEQVGALSQG